MPRYPLISYMKVCVIGAGPAGLYTSKYLLEHGIKVTAYEKEVHPYGYLRCAFYTRINPKIFNDVLNNENFKLKLSKKIGKNELKKMEDKYSAFVLASGAGKPKSLFICPEECSKKSFIKENGSDKSKLKDNLENSCSNNLHINDKDNNFIVKQNEKNSNEIEKITPDNIPKKEFIDENNKMGTVDISKKDKIKNLYTKKMIEKLSKNQNLKVPTNKEAFIKNQNGKLSQEIRNNHNFGYQDKGTTSKDENALKIINAIDIARYYNGCTKIKPHIGKSILIIGCGNVALDVVKFLFKNNKDVEKITLISRKYLENSAFTNSEARNVFNIENVKVETNIKPINNQFSDSLIPKKVKRRIDIFKQKTFGDRTVSFLFNTKILDIYKNKDKYHVSLDENGKINKELYDSVIVSIGFEKSQIKIPKDFKKPVFSVGWAKNPTGSLNEIKIDAYDTSQKIYSKLKENLLKN